MDVERIDRLLRNRPQCVLHCRTCWRPTPVDFRELDCQPGKAQHRQRQFVSLTQPGVALLTSDLPAATDQRIYNHHARNLYDTSPDGPLNSTRDLAHPETHDF